MVRCWRIFIVGVLGLIVLMAVMHLPMMVPGRLKHTPTLSFFLQIASLPAGTVLLVAAYRMVNRRWKLTAANPPLKKEVLRISRGAILLLPLALLTLWGLSYWTRIELLRLDTFDEEDARPGAIALHSRCDGGLLKIRCYRIITRTSPITTGPGDPHIPGRGHVQHRWHDGWGFRLYEYSDDRYRSGRFVETNVHMPLWFLAVLVAPGTAVFLLREIRARRVRLRFKRGLCVHCGYNLTANTSGVCPECGTSVSAVTDTYARQEASAARPEWGDSG